MNITRATAVAALALLPLTTQARAYVRSEYIQTLRSPVDIMSLAIQVSPEHTPAATYLLAWELAILNNTSPTASLPAGTSVRLPIYTPSSGFAGDLRTWHVAVCAAHRYHVSPGLLVAIRSWENPRPASEYKACGVKLFRKGQCVGWWPGGLRGQIAKAAKIVAGRASKKEHEWDAMDPGRSNLVALGRAYADGSDKWGPGVWAIYRKTGGR